MKKPQSQSADPYLIIARKFRPQTFDDVISQEPITTTLKNAISRGKIAQSFLFTGSRGVGKTSTARILAKALNCEKGPSPDPCNACSICEEITQGTSLDVLEIDGASNRGIDEIRGLRENVKFKPAQGRYKIYIIDEVHMLTGEAFNALLKTLEEPPEHVKFVFATTEAHKVPLTILSRCQRFNFRRLPVDEIIKKLKEVAKEEKIKANDASLFLIAKHAEGSMRDAESLLDQMASFGDGEVKESDIAFSLGLTGREVYLSLLLAFKDRDAKAMISTIGGVSDQGKDLIQFSRGLLELFRDLLILEAAGGGGAKQIAATEAEIVELQKFQDAFSREELFFALALLQQLVRDIRWSESPRFLIEACLLKIANRADLKPIDEMIKELKTVRENVGTGLKPAPAVPVSLPQKKKDNLKPDVQERSDFCHSEAFARHSERSEESNGPAHKGTPITLSDVGRVWPELLDRLKTVKMSCGTYLSESEPVEVVDGIVVFGFPIEFKFHKEALEKQANRELVRSTLVSLLGTEVGVSFVVTEVLKDVGAGLKSVPVSTSPPPGASEKNSDIITAALNIFDGSKVIHRDP